MIKCISLIEKFYPFVGKKCFFLKINRVAFYSHGGGGGDIAFGLSFYCFFPNTYLVNTISNKLSELQQSNLVSG